MSEAPPLRSLEELSAALWRERQLVDQLLVALGQEQAALLADPAGWSDGGAGGFPEQLRIAGLLRAVRVDEVASYLGLPSNASLQQLVDLAPEPWSVIIERHRDGLRGSVAAIERDLDVMREVLVRHGRPPGDLPSVGITSLRDAVR